MAKYDAMLETLIINGVNITHHGDTICEVSFSGNWTETTAGRKGDCVTDAKYDNLLQARITVLPTSPQLAQFDAWARARNPLTFQYTNRNNGRTYTSDSAYLENTGSRNGAEQEEYTLTCENYH